METNSLSKEHCPEYTQDYDYNYFWFFVKKLIIISKISTPNGTNALTFDEEEYNNFSLFF